MAENVGNDFTTTLNNGGSVSAGATSFVVTSSTGAPSPEFRIRIDDEIMMVTAVAGTTWTVTRGIESTTGASHADGAVVAHVLTAGAVAQLLAYSAARAAAAG